MGPGRMFQAYMLSRIKRVHYYILLLLRFSLLRFVLVISSVLVVAALSLVTPRHLSGFPSRPLPWSTSCATSAKRGQGGRNERYLPLYSPLTSSLTCSLNSGSVGSPLDEGMLRNEVDARSLVWDGFGTMRKFKRLFVVRKSI